ncbi:MAG: carbamoyltransferase HypF [Candidatus Thermoplasmatota archaeon]|nr:carbamoyltransferase HypF [Candidatus Thermoplasmatota archaeon]
MKQGESTRLIFKGIVQGVGFRPTIYRVAKRLQSHGYVLNKGSEVEVVIDTDPEVFIDELNKQLPSIAKIMDIKKTRCSLSFDSFEIRHSKEGDKESLIPVDTALCTACEQELFTKKNRRYHFSFINCTVCGARYSVIEDVPYDRERTTMKLFPLCKNCTKEYTDPLDRRYHAQTISCPRCGPQYHLYDADGVDISGDDPIKQFAELLNEGKIGVMKSWGGMHLCCTLDQIKRFRLWYKRPEKAFAIMVKDITAARRYAEISNSEEMLLRSEKRPIVLVKKKNAFGVSPGLDTIGIFLAYTGAHHLLFSYLRTDALIMTSANIPGEPMIIDNSTAFSLQAEAYLLHNRGIFQRIDDTVLKPWKNQYFYLRRSRGYVPDPLMVSYPQNILSVGAGENIHGALSTKKMLYLTQYIGNGAYYPTLLFLKQSLTHLMGLTMKKPTLDAIAMDLHPGYETRSVALEFSETYGSSLFEVQHHHAHAASLLLDCNEKDAVVLTLDGLGYGDDRTFWGGELLFTDIASYKRIAHLKPIPLIGGDKAAIEPRRVIYALLKDETPLDLINDTERSIFTQMMTRSPLSSSIGRILDALSFYLGICCTRTYDGEPAMKLERYLCRGKPTYHFEISRSDTVLDTTDLFQQLHEITRNLPRPLSEQQKADLSYSFVERIIDWFANQAITYADDQDISSIGVTGGVSYNLPIIDMLDTYIHRSNHRFLFHRRLPNGDGCIAAGQNIIVSRKL